ncbi:MAG: hypothetical protein Q8P67_23750 [archaeon]|nr:hypothetical protein [archaeon]
MESSDDPSSSKPRTLKRAPKKSGSKKREREGPTMRGQRMLKKREPQVFEVEKTAMFVKGKNTSEVVQGVMRDLHDLKAPGAVKYTRKNDIYPFEDPSSLEHFSERSEAALFLFGNHNKKRPNNLVLGRFFDARVLDMIELGVESYTAASSFAGVTRPMIGAKPAIVLRGSGFDNNTALSVLGNLVVDFFRGRVVPSINLAGLEHVIVLSADDGSPLVQLRVYRLVLKKSGTKLPRVELAEIGPRVDWVVRRTQFADKDLRKRAMELPMQSKTTSTKNVSYNDRGERLGKIHMHKQTFEGFQTRKMKGLKKVLDPKPQAPAAAPAPAASSASQE